MKSQKFDTPILLVMFNRPELTKRVFNEIKFIKPTRLYIAADGPRINNKNDIENCKLAQEIVLNNIDWDCKICTLLRHENLGCKSAVSNAINWFFENEEEGIILEDDTLPSQSFFLFAQKILKEYRNNTSVMHVAGTSFEKIKHKKNFYISKYPFIWGWATWKRAWKNYDISMQNWQELKDSQLFNKWYFNNTEKQYWSSIFNDVYSGKCDTWDYQWVYSLIKSEGLCITPTKNLITNIGFGTDATHTKEFDSKFANRYAHEMKIIFEQNKTKVIHNKRIDKNIFNTIYCSTKRLNIITFFSKKLITYFINLARRVNLLFTNKNYN